MLFNSYQFPVFFVIICLLYFLSPYRYRWVILLAGSYYYYMCWNPAYILLIVVSTLVDYRAGLGIAKSNRPGKRRGWLLVSLFVNLGLLLTFKYYDFFVSNVASVLDAMGLSYRMPRSSLLLPVGISFYTFQTLSYTIDVYRQRIQPERHLGIFALYVAFFPQLVAGPIERAWHLLPQFRREHAVDFERITSGLRLILWGLFKKVVIADRLAEYVARIYADPQPYSPATLALATWFFAFQIYCDFSGYSDIAIGTARVLGFDILQNFRLPYFAKSIPEFWRRWHISLSTWFRDYVYLPLGGNRVATPFEWGRNILIVFLLSGLWHGANWTFVVWGAIHGVFYLVTVKIGPFVNRIGRSMGIPLWFQHSMGVLLTFLVVLLSWCVFRAASIADAWFIVSSIVTRPWGSLYWGPSRVATELCVALVVVLLLVQLLQTRGSVALYEVATKSPVWVRWASYVALIIGIVTLGKTNSDFIYFQF